MLINCKDVQKELLQLYSILLKKEKIPSSLEIADDKVKLSWYQKTIKIFKEWHKLVQAKDESRQNMWIPPNSFHYSWYVYQTFGWSLLHQEHDEQTMCEQLFLSSNHGRQEFLRKEYSMMKGKNFIGFSHSWDFPNEAWKEFWLWCNDSGSLLCQRMNYLLIIGLLGAPSLTLA